MEIIAVTSDEEYATLRDLLTEFQKWMADYTDDIADPEGEFTEDIQSLQHESESWAWLAVSEGAPVGCVLLFGETDDFAEFKRLYVRSEHRGNGFGRKLVQTVVDHARTQGYQTLGLTTPPWSEAAHALYETIGFEQTPPYPETRLPERHHDEAIFMQLDLS